MLKSYNGGIVMYSTYLFDLDGTLTDPKEGITKCVQYALSYFGIQEPDLDRLLCFIGPPLHESFMVYYGFSEEKARAAVDKYRERFKTIGMYENGVYEGIPNMLELLSKSGKTLAVATSKPTVFAEPILEKYGIRQYFKKVVGSELDGTRSDKAEVIEEVLKQLSIPIEKRSKVIMIGDRRHDILGAKKCGIASIGVQFGYAEDNELSDAGADYIVDTVEELKNLLIKE